MPKLSLNNKDSGLIAILRNAKVVMLHASLRVYKDHGVRLKVCPVDGYNVHGLVERKTKTV